MWWTLTGLFLLAVMLGLTLVTLSSWRRPAELGLTPQGTLRPCPATPNCVCSETEAGAARIEPISFSGEPATAWRHWLLTVAQEPGASLVTSEDHYLHAEMITPWLRYIDDLECRLDPAGSVIHVRSASRVGRSDLGVNRQRVERLRAAFARRLVDAAE